MLQQETQGLVYEVGTQGLISPYALSTLRRFHFHVSCAGDGNKRKCLKISPPTLSASSAKKCCTDRDPHAAWWRYPTMQCSDLYTMTPCFWYCSIEKTCLQLLLHPPNHLQYCWLLTLHAADYNCWRCDSLLVLGDNKICRDDNQHHSLFYLCRIFLFCTKF